MGNTYYVIIDMVIGYPHEIIMRICNFFYVFDDFPKWNTSKEPEN